MVQKKPKKVLYRRKRGNHTDYAKRLKLLISGKPRVVVRFTNQRIIAQLAHFTVGGDKVDLTVDSSLLRKLGWSYSYKNIPAAYLTGLLFGKKVLEKKQSEAILDTGFKTPLKQGKVFAFLKGVLDAGVEIPHKEEIFPSEERLSGKHIQDYAQSCKNKAGLYETRFAQYLKDKSLPEDITKQFIKVKQNIIK